MSRDASKAVPADARGLATSLAPLVIEACDNKLSDITWFKADWQRGGAATAKAVFSLGDGSVHPVVIKFPVVQRELLWTKRLQHVKPPDSPVPRLFASGETLGGYDLAWIVIEQFSHGPSDCTGTTLTFPGLQKQPPASTPERMSLSLTRIPSGKTGMNC